MNRFILSLCICVISLISHAQGISLEPRQDSKKPLWGYVNPSTGKWVVKPRYTEAEPFRQGADGKPRALVAKGNLKGFLGVDGNPLGAGIVFESIEPMMAGNNLIVSVKGKKGIVSPDGVYLHKPELTEISPLGDEGYVITLKGKKGIISPDGQSVVEPLYSDIDTSEEGVFIVNKGGKKGLLSRNGEMLLQPSKFEDITRLNNYWKVKKGNKVGLFDPSKRIVLVDAKYAEVMEPFSFPGGIIFPVMTTKGKWGAINSLGKEIIKCKNRELTPLPSLKAIRVLRNNVGNRLYFPIEDLFLELSSWSEEKLGPFMIFSGKVDIPSENTPTEKIAGLSFGEHAGYSNNYEYRKAVYNNLGNKRAFKIATDSKGNSLGDNGGVAPLGDKWLVMTGSSPWAIYDSSGLKLQETDIRGTACGYSPTQGWYATESKVIFPDLNVYKMASCGSDLQFIDKDGQGNWIPMVNDIPRFDAVPYDEIIPLDETSASVRRNGKWGLFSINSELLSPQYESIIGISRKPYLEVRTGEHVGIYNPTLKTWILPLSYNILSYEFYNSKDDSPLLIYNGKWGLADATGQITMPMAYDKNEVLDSLKPKISKPVDQTPTKTTKQQTVKKPTEKPKKKSNTEFQESKERRHF